jgi:hypothetical protein
MSWDWGSTAGAFIGAGIPAVLTYAKFQDERRHRLEDRQWVDAEIIADVHRLLSEIDPRRRAMSVNPAEGVETALWANLNQRRDDVQRRLLTLATGHRSQEVRTLAERLSTETSKAFGASNWVIVDMLRSRDSVAQLDIASKDHEAAGATAMELQRAVQDAGRGRPRPWRRGHTVRLVALVALGLVALVLVAML